jgi:Nucleotidyl transferase AbiEii toxin, Type IV TA system
VVEYQRPRHRAVACILNQLDAQVLSEAKCYFGGGTRIALELNEYRESEDIDFICSDLAGYRTLRAAIDNRALGGLLPELHPPLSLLRDVRADQYGIRTIIGVQGEPVKFEIILEARIQVAAMKVKGIPVAVLDRPSCFAEKWLANADRWNDKAILSRDAIDLAFMLSAWGINEALAGARLAIAAYGDAIGRAALGASTKLLKDAAYRRQCAKDLNIAEATRLLSGLRVLAKMARDLA